MPLAGIGIGLGTALAGGAAAGATVYGAKQANASSRRASAIQDQASAEAIAFEREKEARRQQEYDRQQEEAAKQWQAEQEQARQQYDLQMQDRQYAQQDRALSQQNTLFDQNLILDREARRAPYRAAGNAALQNLGQMLGLKFDMAVPAVTHLTAPAGGGDPGPSAEDQRALALLGTLRNGLTPTSENLGTLISGLNNAGIKAVRAKHANGTLDSEDKIILPSGYVTDQIYNVGGPDARWT